jgi:hypothetical protein
MTDADIITALYHKLAIAGGRHLYGVLGHSYRALRRFARQLQLARMPDGCPFPAPLAVTNCILNTIPEDEFRELVEHEARRPQPTQAHIQQAFERFLRDSFSPNGGLLVLESLELLFAYTIDLGYLRSLPSDTRRIVLLLPGKREGAYVRLFPSEEESYGYRLPPRLIAEHHLWELQD